MAIALLAPLACTFEGAAKGGAGADGGELDAPPPDAGTDAPGVARLTARRDLGDVVIDTWIFEDEPDQGHGAGGVMIVDSNLGNDGPAVGLLRFEVLGQGVRQVPPGSTVLEATLRLTLGSDGGATEGGDAVSVCPALIEWNEEATWNGLGGMPEPGSDYLAPGCLETEDTTGEVSPYSFELDVAAAVADWVAEVRPNRGWVLLGGIDGVTLFGSEDAVSAAEQRPTLTLEFMPP